MPAFFFCFFWPATMAGRYFVGGDALVYSYPLRTAMWQMVRHGQWPLWTPTLLAGYPLLSMAQLGLDYPLTWFYLFLPGYAAEQIYVLAPFLLAPIFTYAYARQIGRSRAASLLAGLSFGFGGMMASFIGTFGFLTNAVMWLPLTLTSIERARTRPLLRCLLLMSFAYAMSVLTGVGQGFLYVGFIAFAYACVLTFVVSPESNGQRRFAPLLVCVLGMALAVGLAAFQILETMQAQRLSIRSKLGYEVFSAGSFTWVGAWRSFVAPLYNYQEVTSFITPLAALMAVVAVAAWVKMRDWRVLFWLALAAVGLLMMLGDQTPLYRLAYRFPLVNLFRVPSRHAFEWTFALAMLSAFGWDAVSDFFSMRAVRRRAEWLVGWGVIGACAITGFVWWRQTRPIAGSAVQHTGMPETHWLLWKLGFTALILLGAFWSWRMRPTRQRAAMLTGLILLACFVEPYILLHRWWFHFAKPSSYFTQVSPPSQFLQKYAPEENRIFTSITPGYLFDLPRTEPHNITARLGFHNAAGYEPLMLARYDRAFGNGGQFATPNFSAPLDRQTLNPDWQVLDLLNVRFLVEFSAPSGSPDSFTEKDGARFTTADAALNLRPKAKVVLNGAAMDTLTLVSVLADSSDLNDGQAVAQINFITTEGRAITRELQAGRDSAEWAHERPDVKGAIRHKLASVFDSRDGGSFPAYRYWSRFDLGEKLDVDRIEITNLTEHASLIISKATAYDATAGSASNAAVVLLTQRLPSHWRKVYDHDNVQIYENPRALPRAWMVSQVETISEEEALRRIRGEGGQAFDPRETALVELSDKLKIALPDVNMRGKKEARLVGYEPNRLAVKTESEAWAMLVLSEINYPGWEATIDGQAAAIFQTDYLLRGVIVPEGKHLVEMRYTAPAARIGGVISVLTLLAICGIVFKARRPAYPIGGSND